MSYKNVFFLKNKANINDLSALSNFDPKIRIKEINNVTLPNEMNSFQSYIFDELHANGGISQMNFNWKSGLSAIPTKSAKVNYMVCFPKAFKMNMKH